MNIWPREKYGERVYKPSETLKIYASECATKIQCNVMYLTDRLEQFKAYK